MIFIHDTHNHLETGLFKEQECKRTVLDNYR